MTDNFDYDTYKPQINYWGLAFNIFTSILLIALGWSSNELYDALKNERMVNGFYVENVSERHLPVYQERADWKGDWVCINVAYDMTPKEAFDTCKHEVMHKAYSEIYAEMCEKDFDKCTDELTKLQQNITKGG